MDDNGTERDNGLPAGKTFESQTGSGAVYLIQPAVLNNVLQVQSGGIGTHITAITKRRFLPNLQRVKAVVNGEVRYIRVAASAIKKGLIVKAPKRTWKKEEPAKA